MFDFSPDRSDNGTPRYTWLYIQIWLDSQNLQVQRLFPHLTFGNIFGAGSKSDYQSCEEANRQMVLCCNYLHLELTPANCEDYDDVIKILAEHMERYRIARKYYGDRIPPYPPRP